jgi:hypothetical protein
MFIVAMVVPARLPSPFYHVISYPCRVSMTGPCLTKDNYFQVVAVVPALRPNFCQNACWTRQFLSCCGSTGHSDSCWRNLAVDLLAVTRTNDTCGLVHVVCGRGGGGTTTHRPANECGAVSLREEGSDRFKKLEEARFVVDHFFCHYSNEAQKGPTE